MLFYMLVTCGSLHWHTLHRTTMFSTFLPVSYQGYSKQEDGYILHSHTCVLNGCTFLSKFGVQQHVFVFISVCILPRCCVHFVIMIMLHVSKVASEYLHASYFLKNHQCQSVYRCHIYFNACQIYTVWQARSYAAVQ